MRANRYHAAMASVAAPVLLIHGDRDQLVPVAAARATAAHRQDWRYVELEGVGHLPQLQVPDLVAEHILGWLGGRSPAS